MSAKTKVFPKLYENIEFVIKEFKIEMTAQELYDIVVNEYVECGDDPESAPMQDIVEIAEASL